MNHPKLRAHVEVKPHRPLVVGRDLDIAGVHNPRAVKQRIHHGHLRDDFVDGGLIQHIDHTGVDVGGVLEGVEQCRVDVGGPYGCAFFGHCERARATNALPCGSDENGFS